MHIVSFWEIAIKQSVGKLQTQSDIPTMIRLLKQHKVSILPISESAIEILKDLPFHHRDPFDRMLIAETMALGWTIISADNKFDGYEGLKRVW